MERPSTQLHLAQDQVLSSPGERSQTTSLSIRANYIQTLFVHINPCRGSARAKYRINGNMTVAYDTYHGWPPSSHPGLSLEDKFEHIKEVGDGSFGSVALARTRTAGANVVRRGTLVGIGPTVSLVMRLIVCTGRHQDDEEDLRALLTMHGIARGRLP